MADEPDSGLASTDDESEAADEESTPDVESDDAGVETPEEESPAEERSAGDVSEGEPADGETPDGETPPGDEASAGGDADADDADADDADADGPADAPKSAGDAAGGAAGDSATGDVTDEEATPEDDDNAAPDAGSSADADSAADEGDATTADRESDDDQESDDDETPDGDTKPDADDEDGNLRPAEHADGEERPEESLDPAPERDAPAAGTRASHVEPARDPIEEQANAADAAAGEAVDAEGAAATEDHDFPPVERPGEADDEFEPPSGPASDQEMPLAEHIEEMVTRLFVVIAIAGVVSVAVFPYGEEAIKLLWFGILPGTDVATPRVYHPLSLIMTQLKVASLAGLIVALPVFVYQTYAFMKPGLYPNERRYYLAAVPTSLVLAVVGVSFAFFIVLPFTFQYFLYYSRDVTTIAFALEPTFNLILLLMGYLAIVFQIPLFIMLAIMMGLVTRRWLQNRRLYFWGGFLGLSFLFNPDPTGMAPIIMTATMITLFEGTLLLLRWTGN